MTPEIVVHPNTGENVGLGHLVRCLTLTNELLSRGTEVELLLKTDDDAVAFACEQGVEPSVTSPGTLQDEIFTTQSDEVVIDSYAFSSGDLQRLANEKTLIVVDELGDRQIPADLVVNNNIYADDIAYPAAETVLRGPKYCMLREAFRELREPPLRQQPTSVLVTVGGSDLADSFVEMLRVTESLGGDITINAVVGPYFTPPDDAPDDVIFYRQPPAIHQLMWDADLAVSGGGQTLYELAVCGTPAVALTLGSDQVRNIDGFAEAGFCLPAGAPDEPSFETTIRDQLQTLLGDFETRKRMAERGRALVDGDGAIRVADSLIELV